MLGIHPMLDPLSRTERPLRHHGRRHWLAAAICVGAAWRARAAPGDSATLLVAGPGRSATAAWAELIVPPLAQALLPAIRLESESVGGVDGVTAANQFQARAAPDGETALLLPGAAALAWLVGDPRARFDAAKWIIALAGTTPTILASRLPLSRLTEGQIVRVAGDPAGPAITALLALELAGALPQAMPASAGWGDVDVLVVSGRDVRRQLDTVAQGGFAPVLALRESGTAEGVGHDPSLSDVPSSSDWLAARQQGSLTAALDAAIAASRLDTALVLPSLTPASMVALWRRACAQAAESNAIQGTADRLGIHPLTETAAVVSTAPLTTLNSQAMLDLRHWMGKRLGWQPG